MALKVYDTKLIFKVHKTEDPKSPIIASGKSTECTKYAECARSSLFTLKSRGTKQTLNGHYIEWEYVQKEPWEIPSHVKPIKRGKEQKQIATEKKKSKFEKEVECIESHLDIFGNTFTHSKAYPQKIADRLLMDGYVTKIEYSPKFMDLKPAWMITLIEKLANY